MPRLLALTGLMLLSALPVQAQVVIRERVEVHPDSTARMARGPTHGANPLPESSPIVGYYVYRSVHLTTGAADVVGAELDGTLAVTTTSGAAHSASIADGYTFVTEFPPVQCNGTTYRRRFYDAGEGVDLLRVPVAAGEHIATATLTAAGRTEPFGLGITTEEWGCRIFPSVDCACFASHGDPIKHLNDVAIERVLLPPPPPDSLAVEAVPNSLDAGETATLTVVARDSLGSEVGLPPQEPLSITVTPSTLGALEYEGERAPAFRDVPYSDLRAGLVEFVASDSIACDSTGVAVLVSGAGLTGSAAISLWGEGDATLSCAASDCGCRDINDAETQREIVEWHVANCPGFPTAPQVALDTTALSYERNLAAFLFGGLGWGTTSGWRQRPGLDGYQTWYFDNGVRLYDYISLIFEAKMTDSYPIRNEDNVRQARAHINLLATERDRFMAQHPGAAYVGMPVYVVASQNQHEGDDGWLLGPVLPSRNYHQEILDYANARDVAILHVRVNTVFDVDWTRNVTFRFMNEFSIAESSHPLLAWLDEATTVNLTDETYLYPGLFSFDCNAWRLPRLRPPPGGIIP